MTHIMTRSSTLGDGDMDGPGDRGAAGTADFGDGITHITGVIGDGDRDGIIPIGEDMDGITDASHIGGAELEISETVSNVEMEYAPIIWLTAETQAGQRVPLEDEEQELRQEAIWRHAP